jgi:glyoxylase-like metal-dependent hydrolase (beta-lactamase superfamily II)
VKVFDFQKGRIGLILGGRYPHCHTLAVDDQRRALIDAASDKDKLLAFHRQRSVDILITSHAHEDHILYNSLFPNAELWVPEFDALAFSDIRALIDQYGLTDEEALFWEDFLVGECNYAPRKPERLLKDGDILEFGHTYAVTIHTPGHTPGHVCLHFPEDGILFLADYDLVKAGPYYGDVSSSLEHTISSLTRLAVIRADVYLTAHGAGVFDASSELILDYLDIIFQREAKLLDLLAKDPRTLDEITNAYIIYGKPKALGAWDLCVSERMMMRKHLEMLMGQDRVYEDDGRYHLAG